MLLPLSAGIDGGMPFFNIKVILIFASQKAETSEEESNLTAR